tara:strand:+ start:444 stop:557 length:114 start_codon:yes stop_codon:yes gene_type:complete
VRENEMQNKLCKIYRDKKIDRKRKKKKKKKKKKRMKK